MALCGLLVLGAAGWLWWAVRSGSVHRRDASFAGRVSLAALSVGRHEPGRITLGRLATARWRPTRAMLAAPRGGSVLVVGPTQSGKTSSLVVPALLSWEGPVLAASVKDDLVEQSAAWRRRLGPVGVLDPGRDHGALSRRFDPVRLAESWVSARSMATALCEAGEGGLSGADAAFWGQLSAKLLSPLLLAAHLADGSLEDVGRWIDERSVGDAIGLLEEAAQDEAVRWLEASFDRDDRQLSSVLATIEAVLAPLLREADAAVEAIDPARLLAEDGTLFLCAPAHEQRRYRPLFTSVTQVLLEEAFARARLDGGRLRRPLLVVLDEAAAIAPLAELDVIAATCASHGITLVTCFQDLAQVRARYGERASTLVNNHRTRVLLAGLADPGAAELLGTLVGSTLGPGGRTWFRAGQPTPERRALVEPHELRQLPEHTAVVVCERLHPVRVALEPWWRQRAVRGRGPKRPAGYAAGDASGSRPNR